MVKKIWESIKKFLEPFSRFMANNVNFILLIPVYFIGIGLVSLISRLVGKEFLKLKKGKRKSNWQSHGKTSEDLEDYFRTF